MNQEIKKVKAIWRRSIVRVLLVMALSVIVPLVAMFVLTKLSQQELEKKAVAESERNVKTMSRVTNLMFLSTEWVVNSFLVNICDVDLVTDSVTGDTYVNHIVVPERLQHFQKEDINELLSSFVDYNKEFISASLILKPGVWEGTSDEGIAISMHINDTTRYNLLDNYDIFESALYKNTAASPKAHVEAGKIQENDVWAITYAVPLLDTEGNVVGEFWTDCKPGTFAKAFSMYKSKNDLFVWVLDANYNVILASNREFCGTPIKEAAQCTFDAEFAQIFSQFVKENKEKKNSTFKFSFRNNVYYSYVEPIKATDYTLLIIKPYKAIYQTVARIQHIFFGVMICSLLLMLLCMLYAFFTYKRKNDAHSRMTNELRIASSIQRKFLPPNPEPAGADPNLPYDVFGFQRTAKSVGGDLYDFVLKDDVLCFCIGDVSGKGFPAALVMSEICSLFRHIVRTETNPQVIVSSLNNAVMERSDDSVLCTLFVGVLHLANGHFEFCNAGHNPPILIQNGDAAFMKIKPNMPVYAFDSYPYQKECINLAPGDRIFAYTDGVTEAKNLKNEFFGSQKTLALLQKIQQLPFSQLVDCVLQNLDAFTTKAEQHDDITILCIEYRGISISNSCQSLHYDKIKGNVSNIVNDILASCGLENDMRLRLAVEEPVQNVADYAYSADGPLDVLIERNDASGRVVITLADKGRPFNPLEAKTPDTNADISQRQLGGLGIHFTRQIMDELSYKFENQQNILKLKYKRNGN